jgi:hypothetical protein
MSYFLFNRYNIIFESATTVFTYGTVLYVHIPVGSGGFEKLPCPTSYE